MIKKNNKGFLLTETLIVTAFVAGVLIYLFIEFTNLNKSYEETYIYNTVEGLYALEDIKSYIEEDGNIYFLLVDNMEYIDITDCKNFTNQDYCKNLFELENIKNIFITHNNIPKDVDFSEYDLEFQKFIKKINVEGTQPYRLVAQFNNSTYATLRFGD